MKQDVRRFVFTSLAAAGLMVAVIMAGTAQARPLPDLIVSLSAPAAAGAGTDIGRQVRLIVKNLGNEQALGTTGNPTGYMVDLTLGQIPGVPPGFATFSPDYAEDVLLKGGRVSVTVNLLPQDFREYAVGAGIPHDTPAGRYFLCATVDPGAVIAESNEDNNTTCRPIRIARPVNVGPQDDLPGAFKFTKGTEPSPRPETQVAQSSPRPDMQMAQPSPRPQADCRNALGGTVTRSVGNLQHGPPRPSGLKNIQVQLLVDGYKQIAETRTDRDGRYAFRDVCPGTYTVCPGTPCPTRDPLPSRFSPPTREITVPPKLQNGIDFSQTEPPPWNQGDPQRANQP